MGTNLKEMLGFTMHIVLDLYYKIETLEENGHFRKGGHNRGSTLDMCNLYGLPSQTVTKNTTLWDVWWETHTKFQ